MTNYLKPYAQYIRPAVIFAAIMAVGVGGGYWLGTRPSSEPPPGLSISLPSTLSAPQGRLTPLKCTVSDGSHPNWIIPPSVARNFDIALPNSGASIGIVPLSAAQGDIGAWVVVGGKTYGPVWTQLNPGDPMPPGPTPPGPPTPPTPPTPPAPIPVAGFRVLVVYETADLSKYPAAQVSIIYSQAIRSYLNSKCATAADGKTKEWWILDKDVDTSALPKLWQDAMVLPRTTLPWIVVSNGTTGFSGPLPADAAATLALLQKYGG